MIMAKIFLSRPWFLLAESQDDLYSQDGITSAHPPNFPCLSLSSWWHWAWLQKYHALRSMPLGGAEILSASVQPGSHGLPQMSLILLPLKELSWHNARFTLPGLIVFWRGKKKYTRNDCGYNEAIMGRWNPALTSKQRSTYWPTLSSSNMKIRPDRELLLCWTVFRFSLVIYYSFCWFFALELLCINLQHH